MVAYSIACCSSWIESYLQISRKTVLFRIRSQMNNGDIRKKITFIVTAEIQRTIQKAKITDISQGRTALTDSQKIFLRKHNRIGQMTQKKLTKKINLILQQRTSSCNICKCYKRLYKSARDTNLVSKPTANVTGWVTLAWEWFSLKADFCTSCQNR